MKIIKLFPIALLILLTGCTVRGPSISVSGPKVVVDDHSKSKRSHCPPGQAKKGRC